MSSESKRELTVAISERYRAADRKSKKVILDEFAKVTDFKLHKDYYPYARAFQPRQGIDMVR